MKKILKEIPKLEGSILLIGDLLAIEEKIEKNTKITEVFCLNNNNNSLDTDSETSESINNDFNLKHLHEYLKNGVDNVFCNYEEIKNEIPSFVREILRVTKKNIYVFFTKKEDYTFLKDKFKRYNLEIKENEEERYFVIEANDIVVTQTKEIYYYFLDNLEKIYNKISDSI